MYVYMKVTLKNKNLDKLKDLGLEALKLAKARMEFKRQMEIKNDS